MEIISGLRSFCQSNAISTSGILVITIQRNRCTDFCSLILDFDREKLYPNYPIELCTSYKETKKGSFNVCYKDNCQFAPRLDAEAPAIQDSGETFCCGSLIPYMARTTQYEQV